MRLGRATSSALRLALYAIVSFSQCLVSFSPRPSPPNCPSMSEHHGLDPLSVEEPSQPPRAHDPVTSGAELPAGAERGETVNTFSFRPSHDI